MSRNEQEFRKAMSNAGLSYEGHIVADGKFHSFGEKNKSWYVFTGYSGGFGDWRRNIKCGWSYKQSKQGNKNEKK